MIFEPLDCDEELQPTIKLIPCQGILTDAWTLIKAVFSPTPKVTKSDLQGAIQNMPILLRSQADKLPWWKGVVACLIRLICPTMCRIHANKHNLHPLQMTFVCRMLLESALGQ